MEGHPESQITVHPLMLITVTSNQSEIIKSFITPARVNWSNTKTILSVTAMVSSSNLIIIISFEIQILIHFQIKPQQVQIGIEMYRLILSCTK